MILPFGELRHDISDYQTGSILTAQNVVPQADGYGPFPGFVVYTAALAAACRGEFYARKTDGSVVHFAGTSTKLYKLNNTDQTWTDVSKGAAAYTALTTTAQWQFTQFGNLVIAVQVNTAPQVFNLSSSSEFADLGGSPPQAAYVATVGRFVFLGGIASFEYRVKWSAIGDATGWTVGTASSDLQDFPDGGLVKGIVGGEYGFAFQEGTIRRLIYAPGSSYIFQIERVTLDEGLLAPYSLVTTSSATFFVSTKGIHRIMASGLPEPIGKERVDRTFLADLDKSNLQLCIGAGDPQRSKIYIAYKSVNGLSGRFDKILVFDYVLNKWSGPIVFSGEYLASAARSGITLEGLDSISGSIDALTIGSLDDIANASLASLSAFNSDHKLGFFTGDNMEATIDTPEQALSDRRVRVRGLRPVTDAATCYGSISARETLQETASYSTEQAVNSRGLCPANVSTRLARGRVRIPEATDWTYATGVEPDFVQEGKR